MKSLPILIAALVLATSAQASGKPKEKDEKGEVGKYVDLLPVAMPIVADGRLVNYALINVRINLTKAANPEKMKAKEPYFRDAMVRMGARTPFTGKKDYLSIDEPRLIAALYHEASRIAGPGMVKDVVVQSQRPKKLMGLPQMSDSRRSSEIHP